MGTRDSRWFRNQDVFQNVLLWLDNPDDIGSLAASHPDAAECVRVASSYPYILAEWLLLRYQRKRSYALHAAVRSDLRGIKLAQVIRFIMKERSSNKDYFMAWYPPIECHTLNTLVVREETEALSVLLVDDRWWDEQYGFRECVNNSLVIAARENMPRMVSLLLEKGRADPNWCTIGISTSPLVEACLSGSVRVVRELLKRSDLNPNVRTCKGTPLAASIRSIKNERAALLLARDVRTDVNFRDSFASGEYPLELARRYNMPSIIDALVATGANTS